MSQQRLNPFTAAAQVRERVDQVEARIGEFGGHVMGKRQSHVSTVPLVPLSTEVKVTSESLPNDLQSLDIDNLICSALRHAGLTHGQACAYIGNGKGKAYDQSQWTVARETGNLPLGRMLANLPPAFTVHLIIGLADAAGLHVSHADIADVAIARVAEAFDAVAAAFRHMRRAG